FGRTMRAEVVRISKNTSLFSSVTQKTTHKRRTSSPSFLSSFTVGYKNKGVTEPQQIRQLIGRGEFVCRELEVL
uniref:Uncharacterized protein n=1 Tax=Gasterosteus aculeatus aculeatus TaxID=481459 RepID=A0AAQ4QY17_GASAC